MPFFSVPGAAEMAAHESWSRTPDRAARTAPARKAQLDRFKDLVDPDGTMPESVREEMAESARKAHYRRMAMKSAKVRARV